MFRLEGVTYSYPGGGDALGGVTARVPRGVTLLAGPNAGGKTTLLRLLAGLASPRSGAILHAENGDSAAEGELRRLTRMVMQDSEPQILGARVGEDIMLGRAASGFGEGFAAEAERQAGRFGLSVLWHDPVESLSYGQKKKLCLVHALLAGPKALLLDEPFAGLDYPSARELREFIRESRRAGLVLVISTHDLEPVFDIADWLLVVGEGKVMAEGRPEELRDSLPGWSVRPPGGLWS